MPDSRLHPSQIVSCGSNCNVDNFSNEILDGASFWSGPRFLVVLFLLQRREFFLEAGDFLSEGRPLVGRCFLFHFCTGIVRFTLVISSS